MVDLTKEKVQEEIDFLSQKGVNVTEIEQQTNIIEDKIAEFYKRLEDLSDVREGLVETCREEKGMQLKADEERDNIEERKGEHYLLFSTNKSSEIKKIIEDDVYRVLGRKR